MSLSGMATRQSLTMSSLTSGTLVSSTLIFGECVGSLPVFAQTSGSDGLKNDITPILDLVFFSQTVDFYLLDNNCQELAHLNDDTLGTFYAMGFVSGLLGSATSAMQQRYKGFIVDWQKVLNTYGAGVYKIKTKKVTSLGLVSTTTETCSCAFDLSPYSDELADETVRFDVTQEGVVLDGGFDFRGWSWAQQYRFPGFFGHKQRRLEQDDYVDKNRRTTQIQDSIVHEYTFTPYFWPDCLRDQIDTLLLANDIKVTDYNLINTDTLQNVSVKPLSIDTEYFGGSAKAVDVIKFEARYKNKVKRNVK